MTFVREEVLPSIMMPAYHHPSPPPSPTKESEIGEWLRSLEGRDSAKHGAGT